MNFLSNFLKIQSPQRDGYLPYIDGLRAIAVLAVLFFHLDVPFVKGGFLGVDIFFVISGFLITKIISDEIQKGTFSFANFYARRIKRIFPALFVMMLIASGAAVLFLGLSQFSDFFKALRMASGQISNIYFNKSVDYFDIGHENSPLLHTWSLGVEEQFYLIWPILLITLHRFIGLQKSILWFIGLFFISLGISEYLVHHDLMASFYLLHARAWELAIGGIVALYGSRISLNAKESQILSFTGLAIIIVCALFYDDSTFPGIKALAPTLGAGFILLAAPHHINQFTTRVLSLSFLRFIGVISYSLYLWHWPLISFYKGYFDEHLNLTVQISIFIISIILATLSYKFVERPARLSKASPRTVIILGLATIALFIGGSNVAKHANDATWRLLYNFGEDVRKGHPLDKICSTYGSAEDKEHCIIGPNKDKYEVILVGDSHASHYAYAVLGWAKAHNLTVRLYMRGACRAWLITDKPRSRYNRPDTDCDNLVTNFYKALETDTSIKYVFLGMLRPKLDIDMKKSIEEIVKSKKKTIFLGQPPFFPENPHECQIKNFLLISKIFPLKNLNKHCLDVDLKWSNSILEPEKQPLIAYLKTKNVAYFDPNPYIQTGFDQDKKHFMYLDETHLNVYGSTYFIEPLKTFMAKKKL